MRKNFIAFFFFLILKFISYWINELSNFYNIFKISYQETVQTEDSPPLDFNLEYLTIDLLVLSTKWK